MHESPADATWGYYDLHSTPTASPYMSARRHSRHESPSSSFKQHTRGSLCSPLPPPLRTIRRVTCLHQLGGRSPNESLTNLDTSSGSGAPTSSTMMMVPPLPKHSPTIHKWVSLPPPPPPPPPPTIRQYTPQVESSVYMRHRPPSAMDGSPMPLLLMAKIGILRQSHLTVVVSLQHQHLTWHAVDASFRPIHGCAKHELVLTPGITSVQTAKKHWTITTKNTCVRFDCPSAGACAAWVRTLFRVLDGHSSASPVDTHASFLGPTSSIMPSTSSSLLAWVTTSTAPIRITTTVITPPRRRPLDDDQHDS